MKKEKEKTIQEVLAAMKAEDILGRGEVADGFYLS